MCGIFGFVIRQGVSVETTAIRALLKNLIELSESRGKEAAGLALTTDRTISVYKEASRGTSFMKTQTFRKVTRSILSSETLTTSFIACIGHTRLVTNGSMECEANNQPVIVSGIVGIHNGIIVNDRDIFARHQLQPTCEVDTEAFLASVNLFCTKGSSILSAVRKAYQDIEGTASMALLCDDAPVLLLTTNNGSLYMLESPFGLVFASEYVFLSTIVERFRGTLPLDEHAIAHIEPGSGWIENLERKAGASFRLEEEGTGKEHDLHRSGTRRTLTHFPSEHVPVPPLIVNRFQEETLARFQRLHEEDAARIARLRRCTRCILPETMPFIDFDADGVCTYCRHFVQHKPQGTEALLHAIEPFRGDGRTPNCLFPLSGGRDSSFGLHIVKKVLGLHPIAYSYDWGMLTDLGRRNQARMCGKLGVEHILISADIERKRRYIRHNVLAWLAKPDLGTVPLFMAGDKQYFSYLNQLQKRMDVSLSIYCENPLEQTNFKYGFCGIAPKFDQDHVYKIGLAKKLALAFYYAKHIVKNPRLLNGSIVDTMSAFFATYFIQHDYVYLYQYLPWDEEEINRTLRDEYDWELADDTATTWRIGDGTAAFYNYIYYSVAGLTENDTFRSNQIRQGVLTRDRALQLTLRDNRPRFPSLLWYGDTIGIDMTRALDRIHAIPKRY